MIFSVPRCLIFILLFAVAGCDSTPESSSNEQTDRHYLNGRSRVSSQDYKGAMEEFEQALAANPQSAAAHFELALLEETQEKNFAAAIYHYERHLKLRPASEYAERARDRIRSCKMDLVKNELVAPVNQGMQRDLDRLAAENLLLKRQLETLQAQLNARPTTAVAGSVPRPVEPAPVSVPEVVVPRAPISEPPSNPPIQAKTRTHVVKKGETVTSIAAKYNVKLNVFLAANPKADPRRLNVGQTLVIPSSHQN